MSIFSEIFTHIFDLKALPALHYGYEQLALRHAARIPDTVLNARLPP